MERINLNLVNILKKPSFFAVAFWTVSILSLYIGTDVCVASNAALEPVTIQLRWFHQFQFAGYYAAIEKGFYADEGLHVTLREYDPEEERVERVINGKVQYGVGDPALLKLRYLGVPVVVLAQIFQHSPQVLISRKEMGILSPEDLIGKKVMLAVDQIGSVGIRAMILDAHGDLNGVTVVPYEHGYAELIDGSVDAMVGYFSNEPFLLKKKGIGVNIMDPRSYGIDFYGDNLFTVEKEIKEHPERVEKVIRATLKGWAYALENKNEIINIILTRYNPELDFDKLRYEAKIIDQMIVPDLCSIGEIDPKRYARIAETYQRLGLIEKSDIPDGFLYQPLSVKETSLTKEEKAWLASHPEIELGYIDFNLPEIIVNSDGTVSGMVVDFMDSLNRKLGTDFGLRIYKPAQLIENVKAKNIDGILNLHPEYAAKLGLRMTKSYWPGYPAVFARKNLAFDGPKDFDGKRVAITDQAYFPSRVLRQFGQNATVVKVDSVLDGFRLVESGDVDIYLGASYHSYFIREYQIIDVVTAYVFFDSPEMFGIGVRSDWPELVSILNKGIALFPDLEINAIIQKYSFLPPKNKTIELTPEEREWLEKNRTVQVFSTEHAPLMTYIDGKPTGISIDFLNEVSKRTRIKFEIGKPDRDFSSAIKGLMEKTGPDVIACLNATPEWEEAILFTEPYMSSPKFIFTRDDAPFVYSMENLFNRTVAVIEGYVTHILLSENYPEIKLLVYKSNEEALRAVSSGKAFAFIGSLLATSSMINQYGLTNLKASSPSALPDAVVGMGVRNDWPELRSIMDKVFDAMPASEKKAIINKWSSIRIEYGFNLIDILPWILISSVGAFVVISLFLLWNRNLAKKVRERTLDLESSNQLLSAEIRQRANAEKLLQESSDYLECILNSLPDAVFSIKMPERVIEWANDTYYVFGYAPDEFRGKTTEFLYPDRKDYLEAGKKIEKEIADGKEVFGVEWILRKKSGELFPAEIKLSFFRVDGKVIRITAIVRNIADRKRVEKKIQKYQERLKALASQLTLTAEKERRAVAVDLHDRIGHSLALARMQLKLILETKSELEKNILVKDVSNILLTAFRDTKNLISDLSSLSMNEMGLGAAISNWLSEQIEMRHGMKTEFVDDFSENNRKTLDKNVRALIFRNVRELLVNVVKHAKANKVTVCLLEKNGNLEVMVEDDGIGFDPGFQDGKTVKNGAFGLFSIQESMIDLGGAFHIRSEPGRGCVAILKLPIEKIQKVDTDKNLSGFEIIEENPIESPGPKFDH